MMTPQLSRTRPARTAPTANFPALAGSLLSVFVMASGAIAADPAKPGESTAVVKPAPAAGKPGEIANASDLLGQLESSGKGLKTLQSSLRRTRFFSELEGGDTHVWTGRLIYDASTQTPPPVQTLRRFRIDFDTVARGNVQNNAKTSWIFDGEWLTEIDHTAKQVHRRQIMPPGQRVDPLALGEGAFPLPIGQQRDKILERFDAELLPPEKFEYFQGGKLPDQLKETYQLRLIPKPGRDEGRRLAEARLWYRKGDLLPRMAWTSEPDGSRNEYYLWALKTNEVLAPDTFDFKPGAGWTVQVDAFKADKPAEPAAAPANPAKP